MRRCNTAPVCPHRARHSLRHTSSSHPVSRRQPISWLVPFSLSPPLSVSQPRLPPFIQPMPRLLSLSVPRSFTHSIPLSLFAHLASPSHSPVSPAFSSHIHHFARLGCQFFSSPSAANFLSAKLFLFSKSCLCIFFFFPSWFVLKDLARALSCLEPPQCFLLLGPEQFV